MVISLLDDSLKVEICYEDTDSAFEDNICIKFVEDCPREEKIFLMDETNIYLTIQQARELAEALNKAASHSTLASSGY